MSSLRALETLQQEYQNLSHFQENLLTLQFFALCPNGKVIPVERICDEYSKNPEGFVLVTLEDRLVLVLQAKFPGVETPYWQQAFYLSTGLNSGMPNTWLPFDGILIKGLLFRPPPPPRRQTQTNRNWLSKMLGPSVAKPTPLALALAPAPSPSAFGHFTLGSTGFGTTGLSKPFTAPGPSTVVLARKRYEPEKPVFRGSTWFSKNTFHNYTKNSHYYEAPEVNTTNSDQLISAIYGSVFLPEGDLYTNKYDFSRFGTISYALASHALGGQLYRDTGVGTTSSSDPVSKEFFHGNAETLTTAERLLQARLKIPSPLQECFLDMQAKYPITKPYSVNNYIEYNKAFSFMNAFRSEGIFPPGLSFIQIPLKTLGYSMPFYDYQLALTVEIQKIWKSYKKGELSLDQVRVIFSDPRKYAASFLKTMRKNFVYADEPEFLFNIVERQLDPSHHIYKYMGGRSRKHNRKNKDKQKTKRKMTRKY